MITIQKCTCGDDVCTTYWLVGIGQFCQGSGFTEAEAQHIADLLNREAPPLEHDAMMLKRFGNDHHKSPRGRLERRIVWNLINHILAPGTFALYEINDGDELVEVTDAKGAMELLFNLDEASLRFVAVEHANKLAEARAMPDVTDDDKAVRKDFIQEAKEACDEHWHGIMLTFGNGEDCISDWNYTEGDPDGFDALVNDFCDNKLEALL